MIVMVSNRLQAHCIIWMTITVQGFPFLYFQGLWRYISVLLQISHCACRSTPLAFLNFKKASCKYELLNFLHLTVQAISIFVTGVIKLCLINFHFSKKKWIIIKAKGAHILNEKKRKRWIQVLFVWLNLSIGIVKNPAHQQQQQHQTTLMCPVILTDNIRVKR